MIDRMDELDGDIDIEEDDPSGDPLDIDGEASAERPGDRGLLPTLPIYGLDQSLGPINEAEANRAYMRGLLSEKSR
jgi:hypothetical protein